MTAPQHATPRSRLKQLQQQHPSHLTGQDCYRAINLTAASMIVDRSSVIALLLSATLLCAAAQTFWVQEESWTGWWDERIRYELRTLEADISCATTKYCPLTRSSRLYREKLSFNGVGKRRVTYNPRRDSIIATGTFNKYLILSAERHRAFERSTAAGAHASHGKELRIDANMTFWRNGIESMVYNAVEDCYIALVEGWSEVNTSYGVDELYQSTYYRYNNPMGTWLHTWYRVYHEEDHVLRFEPFGELEISAHEVPHHGIPHIGNGRAHGMYIDYEARELYVLSCYSNSSMLVFELDDPTTFKRSIEVGEILGVINVHNETHRVWCAQGMAKDYDTDTLWIHFAHDELPGGRFFTPTYTGNFPGYSRLGTFDPSTNKVTERAIFGCDSDCVPEFPAFVDPNASLTEWNEYGRNLTRTTGMTSFAMRTIPPTSLASLSIEEVAASSDQPRFRVTLEWDPIPPPDMLELALSTPITNGAVVPGSASAITLRSYSFDVEGECASCSDLQCSCDMTVSIPSSYAAPYPHSARSETVVLSYTVPGAAEQLAAVVQCLFGGSAVCDDGPDAV